MKQKLKAVAGVFLALAIIHSSCNNSNDQQNENKMKQNEGTLAPLSADKFVKSPLRNRLRLELNALPEEVWRLVGDPGRMPEYSAGLIKVETERDASGICKAYTCYFKPLEEGGQAIVHKTKMLWLEPKRGWASLDEEPNVFGFRESLTLLTLEPSNGKTILSWDMHFNADNEETLQMNVSSLEQALNIDIAQNLIATYGGRVIESYVDKE